MPNRRVMHRPRCLIAAGKRLMIQSVHEFDPDAPALLIDIGNSAVKVATWHENLVKTAVSLPIEDAPAFDRAYAAQVECMPRGKPAATAIASVVPEALERIRDYVLEQQDMEALVVGERLPFPIDVAVTDATAIGADRVCGAAAAYEQLEKACAIVDLGTAITVDLVDDEGTFRGGAILPGINMQLRALHEFTAGLPKVEATVPDTAYGRNTAEAMQIGVCRGVAGAVRELIEAYASSIKCWPHVVATGGSLELIGPVLTCVDTMVEHLTLRGIGLAYRKHLEALGA